MGMRQEVRSDGSYRYFVRSNGACLTFYYRTLTTYSCCMRDALTLLISQTPSVNCSQRACCLITIFFLLIHSAFNLCASSMKSSITFLFNWEINYDDSHKAPARKCGTEMWEGGFIRCIVFPRKYSPSMSNKVIKHPKRVPQTNYWEPSMDHLKLVVIMFFLNRAIWINF